MFYKKVMEKSKPDEDKVSSVSQSKDQVTFSDLATILPANAPQQISAAGLGELNRLLPPTIGFNGAVRLTIPTNQSILNLDDLKSVSTRLTEIGQAAGSILPTLQASSQFTSSLRDTLNGLTTLPVNIIPDTIFESSRKMVSQLAGLSSSAEAVRSSFSALDKNISLVKESASWITGLDNRINNAALTISGSLFSAPTTLPLRKLLEPGQRRPEYAPVSAKPSIEIAVGQSSVKPERLYNHSEVTAIVRAEIEGVKTYFHAEMSILKRQLANKSVSQPQTPITSKDGFPADFASKYKITENGLTYEGKLIIKAEQKWHASGIAEKDATNCWKILSTLFDNRKEVLGESEKSWGEPLGYVDLGVLAKCTDPRREVRRLKLLIKKSGHSSKVELRSKRLGNRKVLLQLLVRHSLPSLPS